MMFLRPLIAMIRFNRQAVRPVECGLGHGSAIVSIIWIWPNLSLSARLEPMVDYNYLVPIDFRIREGRDCQLDDH